MEVLEAIRQRHAVRDYKPDSVPQPVLRILIEAAIRAPSAMNGQPWRFIVITDKAVLQNIAARAKQWLLAHEPALKADAGMQALLSDPQYDILYDAPALILIVAPATQRWSVEACALAAENIMLAATEMGLGSCWIGLAEGWLNTPAGHALLEFSPEERVNACLIVGYPRSAAAPSSRRQPTITWIAAPDERYVEAGEDAWPVSSGLYGSLLNP